MYKINTLYSFFLQCILQVIFDEHMIFLLSSRASGGGRGDQEDRDQNMLSQFFAVHPYLVNSLQS